MDIDCQNIKQLDIDAFHNLLNEVLTDKLPPQIDLFKKVVTSVLQVYANEDETIRPKDKEGLPGGLLDLRSDKPVIIIPDLHARRDFVLDLLDYVPNVQNIENEITQQEPVNIEEVVEQTQTEVENEVQPECNTENVQSDNFVAFESVWDFGLQINQTDNNGQNIFAINNQNDSNCERQTVKYEIKEDPLAVDKFMQQLQKNEAALKDLVENVNDLLQTEYSEQTEDQDKTEMTEEKETNHLQTVLQLLESGTINVLCLGDGVHAEARHAQRWYNAYQEFVSCFEDSPNMDDEISDSFNLMVAVMLLKIRYPQNFHFLKGNHENICNETSEGNYAFAKFANEGMMVLTYFKRKYDDELLDLYYSFEKSLPLFAVGKNFLASHAQPDMFYDYNDIVNYRDGYDVIYGLTWTDNYQSEEGTIDEMIDYYIPENDESTFYFGGHRPIKTLYNCIDNNRYVQIHNPRKRIICVIDQNAKIDLDKDIYELSVDEEV